MVLDSHGLSYRCDATKWRLSTAEKKEVLSLWKQGMTIQEISHKLGCHYDVVFRTMTELGLYRQKPNLNSRPRRMFEMWKAGLTYREIANEMHVQPEYVDKVISRMKCSMRAIPYRIGVNALTNRCPTCGAKITTTRCLVCHPLEGQELMTQKQDMNYEPERNIPPVFVNESDKMYYGVCLDGDCLARYLECRMAKEAKRTHTEDVIKVI